ncbi:MAG: FHA domain-containing protein [Kineosporiaceae bacterium]
MSELTLTLLRLGFLALLWAMVLSVAAVMRRDLFGTRVLKRATPSAGPRPAPAPTARPTPSPVRAAKPRRGRVSSLVVTEGSLRGTTLGLGAGPVLIGRAPDCTLVLEDDFASGHHARLVPEDDDWWVEDLGSTNGTFVGRDRVSGRARLEPGTTVRIGRTVLELRK